MRAVRKPPKGETSTDCLEISLRAYVPTKDDHRPDIGRKRDQGPSEYTLVFDTETTTDASQSLRFGTFQVRKGEELFATGAFFDPEILKSEEVELLAKYARTHHLEVMPVARFIDEIFFGIGYDLRATVVGLNLPFDLVAAGHSPRLGTRQAHAGRLHASTFRA